MTIEALKSKFQEAIAAVDEAFYLLLEIEREERSWHIHTLSNSLADPQGFEVATLLQRLVPALRNDGERDALALVIRSVHSTGRIDFASAARLLKDIDRA